MTESLPDFWSFQATELHYEIQDVEELARHFQKQQENDYPHSDASHQEGENGQLGQVG